MRIPGPRISVLVPTRDRKGTLVQTLDDLRGQTRGDFEVVVGDDASSDGTPEAIAAWTAAHGWGGRLRVLRHKVNVGIYANWNALLREARGEFVAIYHDHDVYLPTIVEASAARLEADPEMSFVHTAALLADDALEPLAPYVKDLPETMAGGEFRRLLAGMDASPVVAASAMVRRSAYEAAGVYDDSRYGLGCDKEMWFRLAGVGSVGYVREPQAMFRSRTRGEGTAAFRWGSTAGNWRMRLDEIGALEGISEEERAAMGAEARRGWAPEYERLMARSALLGSPEERREGEAAGGEFGLAIPASYRALRALAPLRGLARKVLLPRHYRGLAAGESASRAEVGEFLKERPELAGELARALKGRRPGWSSGG